MRAKRFYEGAKTCPLAEECSLVGEGKACVGKYIRGLENVAGGRETEGGEIVYSVECASPGKVISLEGPGVSS